MNKSELLAQLALEVEEVSDVRLLESQPGNIKYYVALVLKQDGFAVVKQDKIGFFVKNEGVVAGPQTYAADVLAEDGALLHSAGDPVLDDQGDQVVIAEADAEKAWAEKAIELPKDKNELGVGYLASKVQAGDIIGFKMTESRPDLGPFSYFVVEVMVNNNDGTVTPANWRVQMDAQGAPFHVVIV